MAVKSEFKGRSVNVFFIFAVIFCLFSGIVFAQQQDAAAQQASNTSRYRVFPLKHITAEQGKKYLQDMQLSTVSQLPGNPNTLLVTASQADLVKITSILSLVDGNSQFTFGVVCPASDIKAVPSSKKLEKVLGNISVGTLFDPPPYSAPLKAIVDVDNDKIIALAPAEQFDRVVAAVMQFRATANQLQGPNQPPQTNKPESELLQGELAAPAESNKIVTSPNKPAQTAKESEAGSEDLFGKLVSSLDDAEKKAVENVQRVSRPNQPDVVVAAKKPQEPNLIGIIKQKATEPNLQQAKVSAPTEVNQAQTAGAASAPEKAEQPVEQRSYEPEPNAAIGNEMLDLNLPEKLSVVDLLGLVGEYLHLDYMYDPDKVKADVTLKLRGPIKVKELYPLLESVLKFRGFAMTRRGNLVTIVPTADAMDIDPELMQNEKGKLRYGDVVVTRFFDLKFIDTNNAKNLLDGMKLSVNVTPIAETGTLIVTGYAYRMKRIEELLDIIDKPGPPKEFRFRPLKYTMAATLAPKVKSLVEQLGGISITVGVSAAAPTRGMPSRPPVRPTRQPGQPTTPEAAGNKPTVYLDADERTNRILMIGFEEQLNVVDELIDSLDVEKQDLRSIRIYDIQHVGAEDVKSKMIELGIIGGEMQTSSRTTQSSRITRPPQEQAQASAGQTGGAISVMDQPTVVILESTNSLLVNATPEQHTQIASIIAYVDTETLAMNVPYEIYALENQDPKNLAEVLTKLIQETTKDKEGKVQTVTKRTEEDIIIVPDENTFSIIVYASKKNQEWIKKLITNLDRRRPQVLIDCTLVEIDKNDSFNYDLNIVGAASGAATSVTQNNSIFPGITPFLNTEPNNRVQMGTNGLSTSGGQAFYADKHIQALLTAMQTKGYGRVLAKPKILVDDGSEGDIQTKNTTSYQTQTVQVPTTGSALTSTNFATISATIELKITPHISEGDLLRLDVSMSRDDFGSRPIADGPPDEITSLIKTTVFVPDNETVILGGLVKLNQTKGGTKVPILGDIPLVGGLFRSTANSDVESKLYIFLKANIVRPATEGKLQDLQEISEQHRKAFEKSEREFQKYEDWPGSKPKPVEPNHVLDEL